MPAEDRFLSLSNLPLAGRGSRSPAYGPLYLEVQVLLTEPDPGFRHRVEEALADKAVRLTSIIPSYPKKEGEEDSRPFSYTDLQKIAPLDMLRHTFTNRFGGDLPEELEKMFNDVMREVSYEDVSDTRS
ncbi:MAG: exonuclease SbcCD subunit D C-terminal domain-containing protein [Parabacteroides merdae]